MAEKKQNMLTSHEHTTPATAKNEGYLAVLNSTAMKERIMGVLPSYLDKAKFLSVAMAAAKTVAAIPGIFQPSILVSIFDAAKLGLSLDPLLGHAYLVPFKMNVGGQRVPVCTLMPGYKGLVHLGRKSGQLVDIQPYLVYANDEWEEFRDETGVHIRHVPSKDTNRGALRLCYVYYWLRGDINPRLRVIDGNKIEHVKRTAISRGGNVWKTDEAEMWKKTAVKQTMKLLDLSPETTEAITRDEMLSVGKMPTVSADLAGIVPEQELKLLEEAKEIRNESEKADVDPKSVTEVEQQPQHESNTERIGTPTPFATTQPTKTHTQAPAKTTKSEPTFRDRVIAAGEAAGLTPEQTLAEIEAEFGYKGLIGVKPEDQNVIIDHFLAKEKRDEP